MGIPAPPGAPSRRLPATPASVRLARRFVRSVLDGVPPDVADDAELLTGELATNAVLHGRTDFEVLAWVDEGRVHVRISDRRPDRGLVPHDSHPYAPTGRGLGLVEELAPSHGVHSGDGRKTVWFELWRGEPAPPASAWETVAPPGETLPVTLVDVPYALYWAAQQHWEGLLRELFLSVRPDGDTGGGAAVRQEDLAAAQDMSNVICACMTTAVQQETPDSTTLSLLVAFPADAGAAVATLRRVLDEAETAAQQEALLSLPALPQIRAFRDWLFGQIAGQLSGEEATAWTLVSGAPGESPGELAPWDASEVEASGVPTVAADDLNRIVAVNTAAANLLGWSPGDLVGRRLTVLIPEHLRDRHVAAFTSLLVTGQPRILGRPIPVPALHRDGRLVPVRLHVQTQEAIDGRTVFVAHLVASTAPPGPQQEPQDDGYTTRTEQGPVRLPTTTKKTTRANVERSSLDRLSLLSATGGALTGTMVLEERLRRVGQVLTRGLADWCAVDLVDELGQVERLCVVHGDPRVPLSDIHLGRLPPASGSTQGPLPRVLRGAGPLLVTDIPSLGEARSPLDAQQLELFEQLGADTAVMAPLRARRQVLGALVLVRTREEHPFTEEDVRLVAELTRLISLGVDNARMHRESAHTAERLQRALLPELPQVRDLEIAARYVPSRMTAEVGGDWYDAFALPAGDTALVIGDVAGHDLQAAVSMSTLRNMLRGIAVNRPEPPDAALRHLDEASGLLHPESTATCLYALLKNSEGSPWELRHSSAGHLPPLLTTAEGETRYLDGGAGPMIGVDPGLRRTTARDRLPPGSTLLMFTDGLIERRGTSIDDAMARLRRHTAALAQAPLDAFCDELIMTLGADSTDDIALLVLRPSHPRSSRAVPQRERHRAIGVPEGDDTRETRQTMDNRPDRDRPATPADVTPRTTPGPGHDPRAATGTGIGSDPARVTAPAGTDPARGPGAAPASEADPENGGDGRDGADTDPDGTTVSGPDRHNATEEDPSATATPPGHGPTP